LLPSENEEITGKPLLCIYLNSCISIKHDMLEPPSSAKIENGEVTCFKNKTCGAISHEAYLAYFLMFLILEFFPQTAFRL